ncbi:hypothetical protein PC9H_000200 [Pleurotus ostreatus]|uniref:Uncharacterized protein n=1 Tax=Pleurotus ostreatus TaxID=5322 RepID=A0A8H7A1G1_PLEOS|nr:uncharacterized protein PC9H_000200 [Pleurotus ostreatus]KAF7439863.1 hypothetical protein PC9H_000200 [Pleurotus ostreatus]KAJ8700957.1 hypothetical protein PTI98_003929 [Pleurotus ostreatus]
MTVSPAGTKAGSDRGGVVNQVPSGKSLELPDVNANNMPPRIQPSTARKSSTGGSHDCDTLSSYLNPSQKSPIPPRERSLLRRFSLLPQPVEPICLHRHSLAVEPVRNLNHKFSSPRGQLNQIHTTSRHSLHRPILSSPLTEVAFSSTNTSSTSLTKCDSDMPERPKFKPSRISSSPDIPSTVEAIYRPRGSRASSYTSPRRPSSINSLASSSSTLDVASPPESSAAAAPQPRPRPRPRPRPSTHRTRYSYTNNPYLTHPQSNKRPIWSPNHKPFYDRYPPSPSPRLSTSLYRNSSQSLGSRPPSFHPIPPALGPIRRSHSLNSSNASLQPATNSSQRPSSHATPAKAKEPLTADQHWNLAHAFAFTPRFSRLGLKGEGVILPIHAKDFRKARRNTSMKSNENSNPASGEARTVRESIPPRPSSAPPSAPPVAAVPPTTASPPRKPGPNKLRKSRPPSLSRPATPRNPSIPQTNANAKVPVKRAVSQKVNKSEVQPGDVRRSQSLSVSGTSRRPTSNYNQRHRSHSGTSTPVKRKEPLTADEHWNLAHAFAFTPRFSRLELEAEGVIMPIHARDFRRGRRNTISNGHPSRTVRQPTPSRPQPMPQPVAPPVTVPLSPVAPLARKAGPNKLRKSRPPSLAGSATSREPSILLTNMVAKDTVKGATETQDEEVTRPEVTELRTEKDTPDYLVQNSASCPSIRVFSADDRRDSVVSSDGASSYFTTPSGSSSLFQSSSRSSSSSVLEFTTRTPDSLAIEEVVAVPNDELSLNTLTPPPTTRTPDSLAVEEDVALSNDELSPPPAPPLSEQSPSPPASLSLVRLLASPIPPPRALSQRDSAPPSPLVDLPSLRSLPSIPGVNDTLDADRKVTPQADANKTGLMRRFTLRLKSLKRNNAAREKVRPNQGSEQSDRKVDPELPMVIRPPSSRKLRKKRRPTPSVLAH